LASQIGSSLRGLRCRARVGAVFWHPDTRTDVRSGSHRSAPLPLCLLRELPVHSART